MRFKRMLGALLSAAVLVTGIPFAEKAQAAETDSLVPKEAPAKTANYVCTWNIQDWVAWHENGANKRDVVDPNHLFNKDTGWVTTMYPESRGDMLFLLDDGWDLPYGTQKNGTNSQYFGCQALPDDKFPKAEWGNTPQEKLKTLNEKIKAEGWNGTGIWICAQTSNAYPEYAGNNEEEFWRMRLQWSKYAGIAYWKIDWGTEQKKIEWRRKISQWAEEEYPELIIEHVVGGGGKNMNNERMEEPLLADNVQFAAFADVYRTYDVLDNLATTITLDRVGEQLIAGYTEAGPAMGLMNAEDEMYICASLGLSAGVMRFTPKLAPDSKNSGDQYYGIGVEANHYFAGGAQFARTKATRNRLDEVDRTMFWERIAPPYEVGAYDTALSNAYLEDDWTFNRGDDNPNAWDGTSGLLKQKAPAVIARGIDLPTVTVDAGDDIPFLTASRNPNGAISIAAYSRTHTDKGYLPVKSAKVSLHAGDLTGKIGIFGYYGSLSLTFNQDLNGKNIYAQDLLADEAQDITDQVEIDGKTLTIDGELLEEIGLSAATKGDTSDPGLVLQIGEASEFAEAPQTNERPERWDVNNGSFEHFHYDANNNETIASVTAAGWRRGNNTSASYIKEEGHSGDYAGIHTSNSDYEVSTYQMNKSVANGTYKASCYVKASEHSRTAPGGAHNTSAGFYVLETGSVSQYVDIQKMDELDDWTYIEIPEFEVTNGQIQVEFYSYGAAGEYLMFDDVKVEYVGELSASIDVDPILEFDFSEQTGSGDDVIVKGSANGREVTAEAKGITFKTDEDGNDIAVYPEDGNSLTTGITYAPGNDDPMKTLTAGEGATIAMWVKPGQDAFNSSLFAYGAFQSNGELGASLQIVGRNGEKKDTVFYRNAGGSTEQQKMTQSETTPYKKDTWQLVAFVENADGTGTFYVDGKDLGTCTVTGKTLLGFATDNNTPDRYYFGFLPYKNDDTHFVGSIDSIAVYDTAFSGEQVQKLYAERFAPQKKIVLRADGKGIIGGQAQDHFTKGDGYVGWLGGTENEGTVTFNFNVKETAKWNMDIYYLSQASNNKPAGSNIRDFVVTVNDDTINTLKITCPEGSSWDDPSQASVIRLEEEIELEKGKNTLKFGNPNGDAPTLVQVVFTKVLTPSEKVEDLILSYLGTVDDFALYSKVQEIREEYDALTEEEKENFPEETYALLLKAEAFMQGFLDQQKVDEVIEAINNLGEITLNKKGEVATARAAYEALSDDLKKLVPEEIRKKLEAAMNALASLETEDPNNPATVTLSDIQFSISGQNVKGTLKVNYKKKKSVTLKADVLPANAINKQLTWETSDSNKATVNSEGKVTFKKTGKVTITATAKDGSNKKASVTFNIGKKAVKVSRLSVSGSKTMSAKKSQTLKLTMNPITADNTKVTWKSSDKKIATVTSKGKVTAKKKGKVTITATAKDGSRKKASIKITVK